MGMPPTAVREPNRVRQRPLPALPAVGAQSTRPLSGQAAHPPAPKRVPLSRLAPPRGAQGLGGWLESLEFGLDYGFGEAQGLEEGDVVAPHGLGVGVIEAQALPEDGKAKGHQRLRLC